jgi:streptogrisin C
MALYGLDEAGAAKRLSAEARAAQVDQHIRAIGLAGYAGSWFDADALALKVASADPADFPVIRQLGGVPVSVDWSLEQLRAVRAEKVARLKAALADRSVASARLDVMQNRVVIGVSPEQLEAAHANLGDSDVPVVLVEVRHTPAFTSGPVRGANGTRNATWASIPPGGVYPCSIGVSVNEGFLFAGHCVDPGDLIETPGGVEYGTVEDGTFDGLIGGPKDAAWVETEPGWTPTAQINGYSDGTLSVPASWSGMLKATLGATICRYGQTTGGPHCGTITDVDADLTFQNWYEMEGLVEVSDSCTENGDSGGPHLALATGQVQGINVGGGAGPYGDLIAECPKPPPFVQPTNRKVYFQPIEEALDLMGRTMLTAHGAAAPVVENNFCEGLGWGLFMCYTGYRSQGHTSLSWSLGIQTGSGTGFSGSCAGGPTSALLTVTNSYGSSGPVSTPFYCHPGSPP